MASMFDEIPFSDGPLDFNRTIVPGAGVTPRGGDILNYDQPETAVGGYFDSLFSSGKVAADAAANSLRSIANIFTDTMSPLATPAGPATMDRAGAGGGELIKTWSGVLGAVVDAGRGVILAPENLAVKTAVGVETLGEGFVDGVKKSAGALSDGFTSLMSASKIGIILFFVILGLYLVGQSRALVGPLEGAN